MKINSVGFLYKSQEKNRTNNSTSFKALPKKSLEVFDAFSKEAEDYILNAKKIKLPELEEIIQKYCPVISVAKKSKEFKQLKKGGVSASYCTSISTDETEGAEKIFYLRPPIFPSHKKRLKFLAETQHETMHAFQDAQNGPTSITKFLSDYMKIAQIEKEKQTTAEIMPILFTDLEKNIITPLFAALQKRNSFPKPIENCSKALLDEQYSKTTGNTFDKHAELVIKNGIFFIEKMTGCFDKKQALKFSAICAENEKEAYEYTTKLLKKQCSITGDCDLDLRTLAYKSFRDKLLEIMEE